MSFTCVMHEKKCNSRCSSTFNLQLFSSSCEVWCLLWMHQEQGSHLFHSLFRIIYYFLQITFLLFLFSPLNLLLPFCWILLFVSISMTNFFRSVGTKKSSKNYYWLYTAPCRFSLFPGVS